MESRGHIQDLTARFISTPTPGPIDWGRCLVLRKTGVERKFNAIGRALPLLYSRGSVRRLRAG
jgi:hypothetical protein